jgi:hypothetical protein
MPTPTAMKPLDADAVPLARAIRQVLCDREFVAAANLLQSEYKNHPQPLAGHCYIACEAYWHLQGGPVSGLTPCRVKLKKNVRGIPAGTRHWWLQDVWGRRLDLTSEQFPVPFPYELGVNGGFLTKLPSARAQKLIDRVRALNPQLF